MSLTLGQLHELIKSLVGKHFHSPITTNKGATGLLLETITGIPHTSKCLDCVDGELKTFPVKKLKNGTFVPKETLAVTMVSPNELKTTGFNESRCGKKMSRMLLVPYFREGDTLRYLVPTLWEHNEQKEICKKIKEDYDLIQSTYISSGSFKSELGTYLQTRTKGVGHGSTSRAFYLRTKFLHESVPICL